MLGRPAAVAPPLRGLLQSPRWPVREAALHALARLDAQEEATRSAAATCAVLDRSAAVRLAALDLLARHPGAVPAVITDALAHRHPRVRCRALRAATQLAPAAHIATLADALSHSHRRVRRTAAELLGGLGTLALPAVGRLARCRCDGDATVSAAARAAFAELRPHLPEALAPLGSEETDAVALLDALSAATGQRRRDLPAGRDAKREARRQIGRFVEELTTPRGGSP